VVFGSSVGRSDGTGVVGTRVGAAEGGHVGAAVGARVSSQHAVPGTWKPLPAEQMRGEGRARARLCSRRPYT
jgi:hypothetical protein